MNNRLSLEVLHARRPTLNYVSPPICEANFSGSGFAVVILDSFGGLASLTGLYVEFDPSGRFRIRWNVYPGALCYNVYRADDPNNPTGTYTLVASCIPDPIYETPDCPACFLITAVTIRGETPFAGPICTECPPGSGITYFNVEYTAVCPSGTTGSPVTIPAGTYTSLFSQANADAKAQDAARAALVCIPCSLPADYYLTYGSRYSDPPFTPAIGPVPTCSGPSCPGPYGRLVVGNNTGQSIIHIRVTFTEGTPAHPAEYTEQDFDPLLLNTQYHDVGTWYPWAAGTPPFDNPYFYPAVDFHVFFTLYDALAPGGVGAIQEALPQTSRSFSSSGQVLTFWAGQVPPCS